MSRDTKNPRWKPRHMPARWNAKNRRVAKMRSKNNLYNGKTEVEPPTSSSQGEVSSPQDQQEQDEEICQMDGSNRDGRRKPSKKRGPSRGTITLGGLKKVEKARKRRVKQRLRKKKGDMNIHEGGKRRRKGPPPPTRSVMFVDNNAGGSWQGSCKRQRMD